VLELKVGAGRTVDRDAVRQLNAYLKGLDKDVQSTTKKSIKSEIGSVTVQMQAWINSQNPMPPMSGMGKTKTQWGWSGTVVKPSLRLSAGAGKPVAQITGNGGKAGMKRLFALVERAGTRTPGGFDEAGAQMLYVLDDRYPVAGKAGGRLLWTTWLEYRPDLVDSVERGLNILATMYNRRGIRGLFRRG